MSNGFPNGPDASSIAPADLLNGLTPAQREAVRHADGPMLVLAGPGSGKTRVVTHRIAYLIREHGVPSANILALTFTNKAAGEMNERLAALVPGSRVWMGTFHRFCSRLLRKHARLVGLQTNYAIYDDEDSGRLLRQIMRRLEIDVVHYTPGMISNAISWAKQRLIGHEDYKPRPGHDVGAIVEHVYPEYQRALLRANAVDFDDLLMHVAIALRDNPEVRAALDDQYRYILVDEYQDTNLAQYVIVRAVSNRHPNLCVTGDPDQSIYGWRGANLGNILDFERDFPRVHIVRLEQNYRSTQRILHVAAELIARNRKRKAKELFTENGEGEPVRLVEYATHRDEAAGIADEIAAEVGAGRRRYRDYAVFYRTNALSRAVEMELRRRGIDYQIINGLEFFRRQEIKDVLAYLQLLANPQNDVALLRVINVPPRGIGKKTIEGLQAYALDHGLPLLEAARRVDAIMSLSPRAATNVRGFVRIVNQLEMAVGEPLEAVLGYVLAYSGYRDRLEQSKDEDDKQRLDNIQELLTMAREFDEGRLRESPLDEFLEEVALVSDIDDMEAAVDRVTLMTLHASKGLEFPCVYLIAVEQGLLPHERSRDNADQMEEERRLMFVGITRAQERLQLSMARYRDFRGRRGLVVPSPFLLELPRAEMDVRKQYAEGYAEYSQVPLEDRTFQHGPADVSPTRPTTRPTVRDGGAAGPGPSIISGADLASPSPSKTRPALPAGLGLTTAAALGGEETSPTISPDDFEQGMTVWHGTHGVGKIVALSGRGDDRRGTVEFAAIGKSFRFTLAEGELKPLTKGEGG